VQLGIPKFSEIGTHSIRKGVTTFLNALTNGPSALSVYLRAGWSLGNVVNRYILGGQGSDQLCGRAATGLCLNEPEFANLPPHFNISAGPILTTDEWCEILPGYNNFPNCFKEVLPYYTC
jgi:hypothetical protein